MQQCFYKSSQSHGTDAPMRCATSTVPRVHGLTAAAPDGCGGRAVQHGAGGGCHARPSIWRALRVSCPLLRLLRRQGGGAKVGEERKRGDMTAPTALLWEGAKGEGFWKGGGGSM